MVRKSSKGWNKMWDYYQNLLLGPIFNWVALFLWKADVCLISFAYGLNHPWKIRKISLDALFEEKPSKDVYPQITVFFSILLFENLIPNS